LYKLSLHFQRLSISFPILDMMNNMLAAKQLRWYTYILGVDTLVDQYGYPVHAIPHTIIGISYQ